MEEAPLITGTKEKALLLMDEGVPVESVYVEVWDDDSVRHEAAAEIKSVNGKVEWDLRLGVTQSDTSPCITCNQDFPRCPGHWGFIEIGSSKNMYLRSSYVHKQLPTMILACICIHCRRPYYNFDEIIDTETKLRGSKLSACFEYMTSKKNNVCSVCGKNSYIVYEEENRNPKMNKFSEIDITDRSSSMNLPVHVLRSILLGLSRESRKVIGIEGLDTEDFFFSVLPVMPNTLRPKRNFEGKESNHQFTVLYEKIAKLSEDMKALADQSVYKTHYDLERELYYEREYVETLFELSREKPEILTSEETEMIRNMSVEDLERLQTKHEREIDELKRLKRENREFEAWKTKRRILNLHVREFDNAYGKQTFQVKLPSGVDRFTPILKKSEGVNVDMNTLVKSKHGLVREKIMGKRVNFCARTVASPAPFRSRADEVWVPEKFRDTLLMTEDVSEDLKPTLKRMAENRMILYVTLKAKKHQEISFFGERTRWSEYTRYLRINRIDSDPVDYLTEGDMVERQLIDGVNYIMLNRQPSIWRYSLGAFRVRFWPNATIGVPEVALKAFNGDFDGDEFNIWTIRDRDTEAEVIQIYSPVRNVLGNARNSTAYGLHFDPVTGIFMITRVVERKLPIPTIEGDFKEIASFLGQVESRYFEEQDEKLTSRRYFRIFLREEGPNKVIVFSSETVVPRDYFIDEVREHIRNMKGNNLVKFHEKLQRNKIFFVPESDRNLRDLGRSYSGRAAFSILLPEDFFFDNGKIKIEAGILVKGTVGKGEIGAFSHNTIFHELTRIYGYNVCSQVIDSIVWFSKTYLTRGNTLSFGLEDYGFVGREAEREKDRIVWVRKLVSEYKTLYETLKTTARDFARKTPELAIKDMNRVLGELKGLRATEEVKGFLAKYCTTEDEEEARGLLLAAASLEEKNEALYKDVKRKVEELEKLKKDAEIKREFTKVAELEGNITDLLNGIRAQEAKNIESVIDPENAFIKCEGKRGNIYEVMGSVGLQTVSGKRIYTGSASNRALPSIFPGDTSPEALGMVLGNFTRGLEPSEAAFLAWAARIGPVVTKTQTSVIGDIANRMTNAFQGIVIKDGIPQEMVRETANCIQMSYGYDNLDPKFMLVRKGNQFFDQDTAPGLRTDFKADKPGQTPIDVASIQLRINSMGAGEMSPITTREELDIVKQFLKTHVVNQYSFSEPPTTSDKIFVVKGVSFLPTQKTVENVRGILFQSISSLKFPAGSNRRRVLRDTLENIIFRITGFKSEERVVDNIHIAQGDKVGRFISGAIQQPIMQAALNSVVWEEKMLIRRDQEVIVEPIGNFIDQFLCGEFSDSIQRYPLNETEYLDISNHGFEIQSVDEFGKVSWKLIEAVTRHNVPEGGLIHVKTTSGREVTATVGKSFLIRRNNKIVQIEGSELKVGDRLPVTRQAPEVVNPIENLDLTQYFPKSRYIYSEEARKAIAERDSGKNNWWSDGKKNGLFSLPYGRSDSLFAAVRNGKIDMTKDEIYNMNGKKTSMVPCNIVLDDLAGFFFGAFLADGCANEYQIILSKKDEKFRSKILAFAARYKIPYHTVVSPARNTTTGESHDIRFHSQMWAKILREECGTSAENKRISPWMVLANKEFARGLIDGYFSGDGTVNKRCYSIIATSASKDLLLGMTEMLSRFGIVSKLSGHVMKSNNIGTKNILPVHSLTIRNEYSKIFLREIGLTHSDKMSTLKKIDDRDMSKTLGLYEKIPLRLSVDDSDKEYLRQDLQTMLGDKNLNEDDQKIILEALNSDVYFDEIISIETASTTENHPKVYDFTIQDTRNFASFGGLHNADTFHSSGVASSASTVKDRFIRLVTASGSGKRSGNMFLNKAPKTFYEAYEKRNQIRELSLASILSDPLPEMRYGVSPQTIPERVRKIMMLEYPQVGSLLMNRQFISYIILDFDPVIVKLANLRAADIRKFIRATSVRGFEIYPVVMELGEPRIYLFTDEETTLKARNNFQSNVIARLSDHKLNFGYRPSGEGIEEAYPTEFNIMDGIKTVYNSERGFEVRMLPRHMRKYGYKIEDVMEVFKASGISNMEKLDGSRIKFPDMQQSPVEVVQKRLSEEAAVTDQLWKRSVEENRKKEPENPGRVTSLAKKFFLKTIGGNLSYMMRHPLVNYRSSYTDGIQEIESTLGLRAARNFMVHEIEQIFSLSGSNEIDYRHVVLMIDSMVSQGTISRLTFQGVDKIAGPNPLNQAGVGYAPANTFAVAALKKREFRTDVGYAVNFLATRPKIVRERLAEEQAIKTDQRQKIKEYISKLPSLKRGVERVDYQILRERKVREREIITREERGRTPLVDPRGEEPEISCRRVVAAESFAFANNIEEFYETNLQQMITYFG